MAAHEVGGGCHEEVEHLVGEDGHERVLPVERVDEAHEALGHQGEARPVQGDEHHPLLRQDAGNDLENGVRRIKHDDDTSW